MSLFTGPARRVLITGGGSGIGFGIASTLAKQGHEIIIADLFKEPAEAAVNQIIKDGGKAIPCTVDVSQPDSIESMFSSLPAMPDVLVNNAGIQHVSPLQDFPSDKWQKLVEVMLCGPSNMTKACLPHMMSQNFGRIINIGSIHSIVASKYKSAYVAAKHGLIGFSKVMALETSDHDITINTVCPAYVRTPLVEKQISQQAQVHGMTEDEVIKNIFLKPMPKGKFIEFEELAAATEFLMSPYARNITGQSIILDGGWTVQ